MRIISGLSLLVYFDVFCPLSARTPEPMSLTYWVDQSCQRRPLFRKGLIEALAMARSAVKKLDTVTEGRQSTYFENIFKTTIPSRQVLSSRHEPLSEESDTDIQALDQVICM